MTKICEMSIDSFKKAIVEALSAPNEKEPSGLINKALMSKVPNESIQNAIAEVYQQSGNFSLRMGVNKSRSAVENLIRAANATELKGIIVGSHDIVGRQYPVKYTLIRADKKHIELGSYDSQVPYQGGKIDIPVPAAVILKAEYDPDYDSWQLVSIEKFKKLEEGKLLEEIAKVIIPISAIDEGFAYHKTKDDKPVSSRPVVIAGTIAKVGPEAVFTFKEDPNTETTTATLDHYNAVMCPREAKPDEVLPSVQFLLNSKKRGINSLRCHLPQMKKGTPNILIPDFIISCEEAAKKFKDPEVQAGNVNDYMKGWPVVVVGTVTRFKKGTGGQDKTAQNWVDVDASCILDAGDLDIDGDATQKKLPESAPQKPVATPPTHATDSKPVEGPIQSTPPADNPPADPAPAEKKASKKRSPVQKSPSEPKQPASAQPPSDDGDMIMDAADEIFPTGPAANAPPVATPAKSETVSSPATPPAAAPGGAPASLPPMLVDMATIISQYCMVLDVSPASITVDDVKTKMLDVITTKQGVLGDVFIQKILDYLKANGGKA